ncbi:chaplin [Streptomyces boncukensis]|uniref:Chaplin n=1 Tax=Streptomyces boncukensis TaxID=2711219 RepID=A0A6G4WXS7_9ACTN|nr:chaplin [Streptomyces boncukensis]NGO69813.1 chaplin [Streptomyces boncukensis]
MNTAKKAALVIASAGVAVGGAAGAAVADSGASGAAANSPGILSGNVLQLPVNIPINACGNTLNLAGLMNPTFGNTCVND